MKELCSHSLTLRGDQNQFSPKNINTQSTEQVRRIDKMITKEEMLKNDLLTSSHN